MLFILGFIVVLGSVLGGYILHHGQLIVLYQPTEYLIIIGAGVGSFLISNPGHIVKGALKGTGTLMKALPFTKKQYTELLIFQYDVFKFMKTKGMLEIEKHLEDPHESDIFNKYPTVIKNHHAVVFFTDYLRLMTMGVDDKYQVEDMMDMELDDEHHHKEEIAGAVVSLGDAFPAIGIVAAVLGVIITMGSISEPPEVLGGLIAAALVGTFLGIFIAYGFVGPMGQSMNKFFAEEHKYYEAMKAGLLAHIQGQAPAVSIEFARKAVPEHVRPSFIELEEAINEAGL